MARHYSIRDFFRQMPNALLARYFHEKNLFQDLDFSAMKEGNPAMLFDAWLTLPDNQRNVMDTGFREILEMSCEKGFTAILHEAEFQFRENEFAALVEKLSALPSHYERAMITLLDYKICWKGATRFYHADTLPYWRKRKNFPQKPAAVDDASIKQLAALISNYFHHTEGRGKNCRVGAIPPGRFGLFLCLSRRLFAAKHRMGRWAIRLPSA